MRKYIEGEFEVTEYDTGEIIKVAVSDGLQIEEEQVVERSLVERLKEIETTLDILVLKSEGVIA